MRSQFGEAREWDEGVTVQFTDCPLAVVFVGCVGHGVVSSSATALPSVSVVAVPPMSGVMVSPPRARTVSTAPSKGIFYHARELNEGFTTVFT